MRNFASLQQTDTHNGYLFRASAQQQKQDKSLSNDENMLEKVLAKGQQSKTFVKLMKKAGITAENASSEISTGSETVTNPFNGKITLGDLTVDENVLGLAHELTNRKNKDVLKQNILDVRKRKITPEVFADTILKIESEGILNQVIVAGETGIRYPAGEDYKFMNDLIEKYTSGELKSKGVKKMIDDNLKSAVTSDGNSARDKYIQDGKNYQGNPR